MSFTPTKKRLIVLGSTGSIGEHTLRVVAEQPERLEITALAARNNAERLVAQARTCHAKRVCLLDRAAAKRARELDASLDVLEGSEGLAELAATPDADTVVMALVGLAGLAPTLAALRAGHDVALATKEVLVGAGELVMAEARRNNARLLPVDSEHSAVFQCVQGGAGSLCQPCSEAKNNAPGKAGRDCQPHLARITLTASGGPFFNKPGINLETVSIAETINHPKWKMGPKISVDSATMMNKGLELIEARWLFDLPPERLDVVVHPESIVHALVEFSDGATLAQLSPPDMRVAIQYALSWPDRWPAARAKLDLPKLASLTFFAPDETRFPCLGLARAAMAQGGLLPTVLNAANETAVEAFLAGKISLAAVPRVIEKAMASAEDAAMSLDAVLETDARTRAKTIECIRLQSSALDCNQKSNQTRKTP
jgi:1-deoxy-D-xylulose-5-phosphate reductoisomerase